MSLLLPSYPLLSHSLLLLAILLAPLFPSLSIKTPSTFIDFSLANILPFLTYFSSLSSSASKLAHKPSSIMVAPSISSHFTSNTSFSFPFLLIPFCSSSSSSFMPIHEPSCSMMTSSTSILSSLATPSFLSSPFPHPLLLFLLQSHTSLPLLPFPSLIRSMRPSTLPFPSMPTSTIDPTLLLHNGSLHLCPIPCLQTLLPPPPLPPHPFFFSLFPSSKPTNEPSISKVAPFTSSLPTTPSSPSSLSSSPLLLLLQSHP